MNDPAIRWLAPAEADDRPLVARIVDAPGPLNRWTFVTLAS